MFVFSVSIFAHLLAHRRHKVTIYAAHRSHWALGLVPAAQTELEAAFHLRRRIGDDFNNLEHIRLFRERLEEGEDVLDNGGVQRL